MKTGVLFDSCTVQETTNALHPLYQIGESLHSLISSLSPDPVIDNYDLYNGWFVSLFSFIDREERFTSLLSSLQQEYHSQYPLSLSSFPVPFLLLPCVSISIKESTIPLFESAIHCLIPPSSWKLTMSVTPRQWTLFSSLIIVENKWTPIDISTTTTPIPYS